MTRSRALLLFLNELTLPALLWHLAKGRTVHVLMVPPVFGGTEAVLSRLVAWLRRRGLVHDVLDLDPALAKYGELRLPRHLNDPFAAIEPWIEAEYGFDRLDEALGDDARAYRHVVCNHAFSYFAALFFLDHLARAMAGHEPDVIAPGPAAARLYQALHGVPPTRFRTVGVPVRLVNLLLALAAFCLAVKHALAGARLGRDRQQWLLGADPIAAVYDREVWDQMAGHGPVLVVYRSRRQQSEEPGWACGYPATATGDGGFPLARIPGEVAGVVRRLWRLYLLAGRRSPELFLRLASLPVKRLMLRKLLASHRFGYFLARDDYNEDHILRSQELRKDGGISLGTAHGMPIAAVVVPMWRHLDFDVYYMQGTGLQRHYARTWPDHMRVVAAGSRGLTRERAARLASPRPATILVQIKPWRTIEPMIDAVRALALRFPGWRVVINVKQSFLDNFLARDFLQRATAGLDNVVTSDRPIYDLFLEARVLVTDPSTVAAEAIQFGLATFMLDMEGQKALYFRDFAGLCFTTAAELVEAASAVIEGRRDYSWEAFDTLTSRTALPFCEAVCATLSLPETPPR